MSISGYAARLRLTLCNNTAPRRHHEFATPESKKNLSCRSNTISEVAISAAVSARSPHFWWILIRVMRLSLIATPPCLCLGSVVSQRLENQMSRHHI